MNDDQIAAAYRAILAAPRLEARNECVDPAALLALVERDGPEALRLATLDHVTSCRHCLAEFELLRAVHVGASSEVRPAWRRPWVGPIAMAATVTLVIGGILWNQSRIAIAPEIERGGTLPPVAVAPLGDTPPQPGPLRFVWFSVSGATQYDLQLVAADGRTLYRTTTGDTLAVLPDSVTAIPGREYHWMVTAHVVDGPVRQSAAARFIVR